MRRLFPLVAAALIAGAGCRGASSIDRTRPVRDAMPTEAVDAMYYKSANDFGLNYLKAIQKDQGGRSFAAAPFGAYTTMTVFAVASSGKTRTSVSKAMHAPDLVVGDLSDTVMYVQDRLYRSSEVPFVSQNAIFTIWPIMLDKDFQFAMNKDFRFEVTRLGSAGVGSENRMNEWVSAGTDKKMTRMVDSLSKETIFVALNPVLVGGAWAEAFDSSLTRERTFVSPVGDQAVPMMERTGDFRVAENDRWTAVTLPYKGSSVQATFVLPKTGDASQLLHVLNGSDLPQMIVREAKPATVRLPKFTLDSHLRLSRSAKDFGVDFLFRAPIDLRYMSVEMQGDYEMGEWHQRVLATFEERGDAPPAAASKNGPTIAFDRPFVWLLTESTTGVIVAGGIYSGQDPKK